jgi:hypothetical protein
MNEMLGEWKDLKENAEIPNHDKNMVLIGFMGVEKRQSDSWREKTRLGVYRYRPGNRKKPSYVHSRYVSKW